jgi:hypothetical protein
MSVIICYYSILLHCVDLVSGIRYQSTCNHGWYFLFSLLQMFKYTTCFSPTGHLGVYSLVSHCRTFKAITTVACSFSGWHCVAVQLFSIYYFKWSNFPSLPCEAVFCVFVFSGFNLIILVADHLQCYQNRDVLAVVIIDASSSGFFRSRVLFWTLYMLIHCWFSSVNTWNCCACRLSIDERFFQKFSIINSCYSNIIQIERLSWKSAVK